MNKIIKIALISIVIIGIISIIIYFVNGTDKLVGKTIATTQFEKYIENKVNNSIKGKDYAEASQSFDEIIGEIETEASIVNSDGNKQLSVSEVQNCKKIAFYAYVPVFDGFQSTYFNKSSWSDGELSALKTRANSLLSMNIAEENVKQSINKVITTVNEYHAAWSVVKSARGCSSVAAAKAIKSKVAQYNHPPLTNNASLRAGLNSAYSDAKSSLASNINAYCRKVAQGYKSYGSYERFYAAEEAALAKISEYVNAFGGGSFGDAKSMLSQADENAMDFYPDNF